ncbi:MAG TPA: hypothetical protein VN520_12675 [Streptomyces sp.]|uniref:hypothetical protein n=1 Tax=Streptomyces sp. TaxID=1931 RepID=UPI002B8D9D3D|nr:hypothetical protein [Streptomyces sp.]HWU07213.1 hypothetical protein [Streptomyces sp.]
MDLLWPVAAGRLATAVLASLYPAVLTVLGLTLLNEKVARVRMTGLMSAAAAIVLLPL